MSTYAIVLGGGSGTRMQISQNKVFLPLKGIPAIVRAIAPFTGFCKGIVVVAQAQEVETMQEVLSRYGLMKKVCAVVCGGQTRQQSVFAGLKALPSDAQYVLVHDGARALITEKVIRLVLESTIEKGTGIASVQVTDTIKRADEQGRVLATIPRADLFAMQTPQGFVASELIKSHTVALEGAFEATDDAAVMEYANKPVYLCEGDKHNIKLTTRADLQMALAILEEREMEAQRS